MSNTLTNRITNNELKSFGILMTWAFPLFLGVIAPFIFGHAVQWWTLWVSAFFLSFAFIAPRVIYGPYKIWMFIAGIIGWINTRIILGFTFYVLIFPLGFILRTFGKLQYKAMHKTSNKTLNPKSINKSSEISSYVTREEALDKNRLEQPF